MTILERLGRAAGWLLSPVTGTLSLVRGARMFHPEGTVYGASIEALPGPFAQVARRIEGKALARLSTALWRSGREWPDALGIALRIGKEPAAEARPGDQDLLFATIRYPWTMPFSPLSTRQHDYLANDYFAVAPFEIEGVGRAKLRLRGPRPAGLRGRDRGEKLQHAIERGEAVFHFELFVKGRWEAIAAVRLLERVEVDQAALRFWPDRAGRGFVPRGFVEAMRRGTYFLSQAARPAR